MSKSITAYLRGVTATVALCATGFAAQAQELLTAADVAGHTPDAKNGEQVYNAAGCATCHSVEGDLNILAGGRKFENRLGTLFAPNITNHSAGIGSWSDVDFVNAVLRGQSPEGEQYISAFFPYPAYARMSVEDALDLRAYIKTLPESDAPSKDHKVNRLGRTAFNMQSTERAPLSGAGDEQMKRGEYLAEALGHCGECHTPRKRFSMDLDKRYQGYLGYFGEYAPDISPTRLANIDAATFAHGVLVEGKKLNGRPIAAGSMRRIVQATQKMSREDRAALFAYLSKKPVDASSLPEVTLASATGGTATVAPPKEDPVKAKEKEKIEEVAKKTGSEGLMMQVSSVCDAPEPEAAVALTAASSAEVGVDPEIERAADRVMDASCRTCHGPGQRNEKTFPMHDIVDMARDPSAVKPGDPEGSNLYQSIAGGRMPLGPQMTPEDVDAIRAWIVALGETGAAAPAPQDTAATVQAASSKDPEELPTYAGGDFTTLMLAAVTDLDKQSERSRPYIRYLDFSNTPLPQVDCDAPPEHRNPMFFLHAGLNKFINSVSRGETLVPVTPVDGTDGALVRIDIRDYGWDVDDWRALSEGIFTHGAEEAGFDEKAWEELAVVYPYAMDPHSDAFLNVLAKGTHTAVPILNADWFTHFGSTSPYYDVLLRLPEHIRILERRLRIDVDREILDVNMIRAGFAESGVSDHNRMLERFDLKRNGYYWKSYDFAGDDGQQLLTRFPDGPAELGHNASGTIPFEHDGGEMIFSLENGMQGYYLSTAEG